MRLSSLTAQLMVCIFFCENVFFDPSPIEPESTQVLSAGTQSGIIRLGNALPSATSFPGFGIKWPRSSVHSADLVGLRVSGPGGSCNFLSC